MSSYTVPSFDLNTDCLFVIQELIFWRKYIGRNCLLCFLFAYEHINRVDYKKTTELWHTVRYTTIAVDIPGMYYLDYFERSRSICTY